MEHLGMQTLRVPWRIHIERREAGGEDQKRLRKQKDEAVNNKRST
jgi:hypothetical protein